MRYIKRQSLKYISLVFVFGFFTLNIIFFLLLQYPNGLLQFENNRKMKWKACYPDPIDIVYTWVNGSDPRLIKEISYYKSKLYLETNMESRRNVKRLHCPFENCGFNDHFFVSPVSNLGLDQNVFIESVSMKIRELLNSSDVNITFISQVDKSTYSRKSGIIFQSSKSMSNLFINFSEFSVDFLKFPHRNFTISKILIAATNSTMGYTIEDHVFVTGFSEMRDKISEDKWSNSITNQLPNNTKVIKSSATGFLLVLPDPMNVQKFFEIFNSTIISPNIRVSRCVLILDADLITIMSDLSESRFQDNDELKYSLRSLERFVDFFRHIFIVTNGQIPSWLNVDHPEITVVPHSEIFRNKSHLPTFNSAAIEANLHNIPGLASHFLYLNDDVFFGDKIYPEDFYSPTSGYKVYLGWSVPNCVENCPNSWLADGFCDHDCNVPECDWDAGDCAKGSGKSGFVNFHHDSNQSFPKSNNVPSMFSGIGIDFCSQGCNNIWLADRYCDQACNVEDCGFDLGDCGDLDIMKLPSTETNNVHDELILIANDSKAFVINLQKVIHPNDNVTKVTIDDTNEILSSSYAIKYRIIVILFKKPDSCKSCFSKVDQMIRLNITLLRGNSFQLNIQKKLVLNPSNLKKSPKAESISNHIPTISPGINLLNKSSHLNETVPDVFLITNVSNNNISIELLEWEKPLEMTHYRLLLQDGLISLDGYHHLVNQLFHTRLEHKQQNLRMTAFPDVLRIERMPWGFLPWEKSFSHNNINDYDNLHTVSSLSSVSSMRRLLDLYAESLRHSSKMLSEVFSSSNKRVPAHGPHFISNKILGKTYKKFYNDWVQTSSHRFRSPNDVQFAFTYFSFMMNVNVTVPLIDTLQSVDNDHSGSLNANELRSLILKIHSNETVSPSFIHQRILDISNSCIVSVHKLYDQSFNSININISELITCFNWSQLYTPKPIARFRHTNHEDNDLAFIMISTNFENILKNLDWLRKSPKKFFCLNDNLPNSGDLETVSKIRVEVKNFLDFMFPLPSKYEFVPARSAQMNLRTVLCLLGVTVLAMIIFMLSTLSLIRKLSYFITHYLLSRKLSKCSKCEQCNFNNILIKS